MSSKALKNFDDLINKKDEDTSPAQPTDDMRSHIQSQEFEAHQVGLSA